MSTLLKKKYCKEHDRSCAATDYVSDRDEAAIQNAEPCSLSTITDENSSFEGDCDPVSDQGKSVQFDLDRIVVINGKDRETLHQHREDIWYTREEYRNFWTDRLNSVHLWKMLQNESIDDEANNYFVWNDQEYTIRGLENHVYSSTQILNRQRDLYSVVVFQDPYNVEGIHLTTQDWSRTALQRAQLQALQDAADVREGTAPSHHLFFTPNVVPVFAPSSPSSVTNGPGNSKKRKASFLDIAQMNKRLIEQHIKSPSTADTTMQKPKRRPSAPSETSHSTCIDGRTNYRRRFSTSSAASPQQRQPVSLRFHSSRQPRRLSLAEDFSQHMKYGNHAGIELPLVAGHRYYHRDSIRLSCNLNMDPPDPLDLNACTKQGFSKDDENMFYKPVRRDSLHLASKYLQRPKSSIALLTGMTTQAKLSRATSSDVLRIQDFDGDFKRRAMNT